MKDVLTMSYVNMFAVLKTLENLCAVDEEARAIAAKGPISIGFNVQNGPKGTLYFADGACRMLEGAAGRIKLLFRSPEHLNAMIDGKANPIPYGGLLKIGFLTKDFIRLTDILTKYLRASDEDLKDRAFFEKSTFLMFHLIANALAVIGNHDPIATYSAKNLPDGKVSMEITDRAYATILAKDHHLETIHEKAENPRSYMIFQDYDVARGLFDGSLNSFTALADGRLRMKGYIPQIDNLNRILNRVAAYLA